MESFVGGTGETTTPPPLVDASKGSASLWSPVATIGSGWNPEDIGVDGYGESAGFRVRISSVERRREQDTRGDKLGVEKGEKERSTNGPY